MGNELYHPTLIMIWVHGGRLYREKIYMVRKKSYVLSPVKPILTMARKYPENSPEVEESHGTNNLFTKTHEDHPHPPLTGQQVMTSTQKL